MEEYRIDSSHSEEICADIVIAEKDSVNFLVRDAEGVGNKDCIIAHGRIYKALDGEIHMVLGMVRVKFTSEDFRLISEFINEELIYHCKDRILYEEDK